MNKLICGDCLTKLQKLPDESVNCCITSPPYWGLRDYSTKPIIWGGDKNCQHEWTDITIKHLRGKSSNAIVGNNQPDYEGYMSKRTNGNFCLKCNA